VEDFIRMSWSLSRTKASATWSHAATDQNQALVDVAAAVGAARTIQWLHAEAMALPFPDNEFDALVCQFGVMFPPTSPKAFSEARRVLRAGGVHFQCLGLHFRE
jgi:ubiquinone/menaquinone biosynthesis C-methylase UbiE